MVRVSLTAAVLLLLNGVDAVAHKLVRYGAPGLEQPGLIDSRGQLRTLSEHFEDFDPATLGSLHKLDTIALDKLPLVEGEPRLGAPVTGVRKLQADSRTISKIPVPDRANRNVRFVCKLGPPSLDCVAGGATDPAAQKIRVVA